MCQWCQCLHHEPRLWRSPKPSKQSWPRWKLDTAPKPRGRNGPSGGTAVSFELSQWEVRCLDRRIGSEIIEIYWNIVRHSGSETFVIAKGWLTHLANLAAQAARHAAILLLPASGAWGESTTAKLAKLHESRRIKRIQLIQDRSTVECIDQNPIVCEVEYQIDICSSPVTSSTSCCRACNVQSVPWNVGR